MNQEQMFTVILQGFFSAVLVQNVVLWMNSSISLFGPCRVLFYFIYFIYIYLHVTQHILCLLQLAIKHKFITATYWAEV